jgi:hypothetical protein
MNRSRTPSLAVGFLLLASSVMGRATEGQEIETIRSDGEPLVTQFNVDVGKVRAIFLASPT